MTGDMVEIEAVLTLETDDAYLIDDGSQQVWIPKSLSDHDVDACTFEMPEWLAMKKGLI